MNAQAGTAAGDSVEGRYRLTHKLGEGTFGEVWRAQDERLAQRAVAIKFLKGEFLSHPEAVARFGAEADALAQVQHPNVVAVLDRGVTNETHFLVTEFVEGRPLTAWIEEHRARGEFPSIEGALTVFDQMCAGLGAAHAVRVPGPIVHRDVKPDNVLVRWMPDGEPLVKVVDFGIAQLGQRSGTRTGALMGTPLYMAPEQATGNSAAIGPWTDVFSLAVVLVEMLTLRVQAAPDEPCWWGTVMQRGGEVRDLLFALREDVPVRLWNTLAWALHARGPERPADASALRAALRALRTADGVPTTPLTRVVQGSPTDGRSPHGPPAHEQSPHGPARSLVSALYQDAGIAGTVVSTPSPAALSTTAPLVAPASQHGAPRAAATGSAPSDGVSKATLAIGATVFGVAGLGIAVVVAGSSRAAAPTVTARSALGTTGDTTPIAPQGAPPVATPRAFAEGSTSAPERTGPRAPGPPLSLFVITDPPNMRPVRDHAALWAMLQQWSSAALESPGAAPLDAFYAASVQFRGSGRSSTPAAIANYFSSSAAQGMTFSIDWERSGYVLENASATEVPRACSALLGASGPVIKVRARATENSPERATNSGGQVPCPRLEGVYLLRVRNVEGTFRICHETWSLREGVCVSCPQASACQSLIPTQ
jgi:hypothetical protein